MISRKLPISSGFDSPFYQGGILINYVVLVKSWKAAPENARLYQIDDPKKRNIGAWCAAGRVKGNWLQVDLGKVKSVRYIATQGKVFFGVVENQQSLPKSWNI